MAHFKFFAFILLLPLLVFGENARTSEDVFTQIYETKHWGSNEFGEGYSGSGSRLDQTEQYRAFLQKFLSDHNIRSVVDVGCGDWTFSKAVDWTNVDYKGFDVVESVIEKNKKKYETSTIHFEVANASEAEFPPADLLLCKDVLQHLPNEDIHLFLEKIKHYKYCLITNDINPMTKTSSNLTISRGDYRHLDLRAPPFSLIAEDVLTYQTNQHHMKQVLFIIPSIQKTTTSTQNNPTILLAILAHNKAHVLLSYLDCIEHLEYNKKNSRSTLIQITIQMKLNQFLRIGQKYTKKITNQ